MLPRLLQILVFVMVTEIIGGFANAFGNSIGFFMSQSAERALQIHETMDYGVATQKGDTH